MTPFLKKAAIIILTVMVNVFISACVGGVIFIQLIEAGFTKHATLAIVILSVLIVQYYIAYNHKLLQFTNISKQEKKDE